SLSPLLGTWTRDGSITMKPGSDGPEFTKLTFRSDGTVYAGYVAGGLGAIVGGSPSVKNENDTYTISGDTISIAEGSRHLNYSYRVDGTKLFLTREGASDAAQ